MVGVEPFLDHESSSGQVDERTEYEHLVTEWVHDPTEGRYDVPSSGQCAVEGIRDGGDHEQSDRHIAPEDPGVGKSIEAQGAEEAGRKEDPGHGEDVGDLIPSEHGGHPIGRLRQG